VQFTNGVAYFLLLEGIFIFFKAELIHDHIFIWFRQDLCAKLFAGSG